MPTIQMEVKPVHSTFLINRTCVWAIYAALRRLTHSLRTAATPTPIFASGQSKNTKRFFDIKGRFVVEEVIHRSTSEPITSST
jgi:hypothetical protein